MNYILVHVWIAMKGKIICVWRFKCGSFALFTGPASTKKFKNKVKTGFHGNIYIFKNCFATVFSVFSNKQYPNTPLVYPIKLCNQGKHTSSTIKYLA